MNLNINNNKINKSDEFIDSLQITIPLIEYSKLKREKIKFNNLWNSITELGKCKVLVELNKIVYKTSKGTIDEYFKNNNKLYPIVQINFSVKDAKTLILNILKSIFNISIVIDIRIKDLELVGFKYRREDNDESSIRVLSYLFFKGGNYE